MLIICLKESSYEIPETVKKAKNIVNTAAVGPAKVERALSLINNIVTQKRSSLQSQRTAVLITNSLLGQPLELWDPVRKIMRSHHSAEDTKMKNAIVKEPNENLNAIWNVLKKIIKYGIINKNVKNPF
jgi:predicted oxidoreductase (fatty acid repression mutant protein)